MADALHLRIDLEENVSEALARGIAAGLDLTPAMKSIAVHLSSATKMRFESERGPDGTPWKPSQRALEEGGQTLTLSGDLRGSIREDWGRDYAAAGPERSGGAAIYAKIHQLGGVIVPKVKKALSFGGRIFARVVMPARPYLGFGQDDPGAIAEILMRHLRLAFEGRPSA